MEIFGSVNLKTRLKARVEAILFLAENPMSATEISKRANADLNLTREALVQLVQEYETREGGLMIDTSRGYFMQIQEEFEDLTDQILPIQLKTGCIRTLSVIALEEPLYQSDLVQKRGGGAYEQIKDLVAMGLVKKRKEGHKNVLVTTKLFDEYFKLSQNGIELQDVLKDKRKSKKVEFSRKRIFEEDIEEAASTSDQTDDSEAVDTETTETAVLENSEIETTQEKATLINEAVPESVSFDAEDEDNDDTVTEFNNSSSIINKAPETVEQAVSIEDFQKENLTQISEAELKPKEFESN